MSTNKFLPHVHILPEDDANRQLALGFSLHEEVRQLKVLPCAGGWNKVLEEFKSQHEAEMRRHPNRHLVLLVDFDEEESRLEDKIQPQIPDELRERVIVLGVWSEPEKLKAGRLEDVGRSLAEECRAEQLGGLWGHPLLSHNAAELGRCGKLKEILFRPA